MRKSHWEQITSDGNTTCHQHRRQKEFPQVYRPHRKQSHKQKEFPQVYRPHRKQSHKRQEFPQAYHLHRKRQGFPSVCRLRRRQKLCFCYSIQIN